VEEEKCENRNLCYFVRDKNKTNIDKFHENLRNIVWSDIPGYNDPQYAYSVFLDKFTNTYNSCFPLKKIKISKHKSRKPWVSKGLLKSIKRKNKLYRKYMNQPCNSNENNYKTFKNKLNHLLRIAKRMYYEKQLERVKTNTKNTWKILNEVINRKKAIKRSPTDFIVNNRNISNPVEIADHFCEYFTNIGPNLTNNIDNSSCCYK
jgi:hypothetical protein